MKYAVIKQKQIHHEGDERSRTHPGHGYPAYTETVTSFETFRDEEAMLRYYQSNWKSSSDVFIKYEEISFKTTVEIAKN